MADVYVKLDDVINIIKEVNWNLGGLIQHLKEHCPTADVAPKSEVVTEVIDRLAREGLLNVEPWAIDELKKEYMEGD